MRQIEFSVFHGITNFKKQASQRLSNAKKTARGLMNRSFTIAAIILCLCCVAGFADPCRYEWRSFGAGTTDLMPLFRWWTFYSGRTNQLLDLTVVDSNKLVAASNVLTSLVPNPMPGWHRVEAAQILVVGPYWKVEATVWPAPMIRKKMTLYLANPPSIEIRNFKIAQTALIRLRTSREQNADMAVSENGWMQSDLSSSEGWSALSAAFPYNASVASEARAARRDYQRSAAGYAGLQSSLNQQDELIARLDAFLNTFPSRGDYRIDHFARRTGKSIGSIEVFDLGGAEGLGYEIP